MSPHTTNRRGAEGNLLTMKDPGDAGTISVGGRMLCYVNLVTAAAETRTLGDPSHGGQILTLCLKTDGGDCTVTASSAINQAGDTSFIMDNAGDTVTLVGVEDGADLEWRVTHTDGVAVQTVTINAITEATAGSGVTVDTAVIRDGSFHGIQGAPTAETGAATITIADILSGIVTITQSTGATVALTVDTGTAMDTGMPASFGIGQYIDWTVINLSAAAADTATVTTASGHTLVGTMIVQSAHASTGLLYGNSVTFRSRRTAANTWITYRAGG
jgi:hypothetical protein